MTADPSNPTSSLTEREELLKLCDICIADWERVGAEDCNDALVARALKARLQAEAKAEPAAGMPTREPYETGWVIEHGASEVSRPRYWGGIHGWTYNNLEAVRFAREEDACSVAASMDDGVPNNYRVAEHGWG